MFSFSIFILSGVGLALLTLAKRFEVKKRKSSLILRTISRGDEGARHVYHEALHWYSNGKHRFNFFVTKQLPLRIKSYVNKGLTFVKEKSENRFGNIRNSRFIRRDGSISEFFKNISKVEKDHGELHDEIYVEPSIDDTPLAVRITHTQTLPNKPARKRNVLRKKLSVVEVAE